jgi:hypothetical protein
MKLSEQHLALANELRAVVQQKTETISDGEGVAMFLLWSFLTDHANIQELNINTLAREQLDAFIRYTGNNPQAVNQR